MNIIELAKATGQTKWFGTHPDGTNDFLGVEFTAEQLKRFAALVREQTLKDDKDLLTAYLVGFNAGLKEREWVDLTDDEIINVISAQPHAATYAEIGQAVIAAFKEKNK